MELVNHRFGALRVLTRTNKSNRIAWECICDCGKMTVVDQSHLRQGNITSCKHCSNVKISKANSKDITGNRYGNLTAIERLGRVNGINVRWRCVCDCGNHIDAVIGNLTSAATTQCRSCSMSKLSKPHKDMVGQVFGRLTVLKYLGESLWACMCSCGEKYSCHTGSLKSRKDPACYDCARRSASIKRRRYICDGLGNQYWQRILRGAKDRGFEVNITPEEAYAVLVKQNFKCALSNVDIVSPMEYDRRDDDGSLDRIDSSLGYLKDNIQWIHKPINSMKMDLDNDYFIEICVKIANHKGPTPMTTNTGDDIEAFFNDAVEEATNEAVEKDNATVVYSKPACSFCVRAKQVLKDRDIPFTEINIVSDDPDQTQRNREALIDRVTKASGKAPRTMPQIFLNGTYIGGHDDLVAHFTALDAAASS